MVLPGSYANGFAPRDGSPLYPELWQGCVGAWAPYLGPTGLTLRDWSGFGNHRTLTNMDPGTDWVLSGGRYALDFDGTNDYVDVGSNVNPLTGLTVSVWAYLANTAGEKNVVVKFKDTNGEQCWRIYVNATAVNTDCWNSSGTRFVVGAGTVVAQAWYHIAFTFDGMNLVQYLNGLATGSAAASGTIKNASQPVTIGARINSTGAYGNFLNGQIRDVSIHNRPLNAFQIKTLATRPGIAYELAARRRASVQVAASFNRRRRLLVGAGS